MAKELYISSSAAVQPYALVRRKSDGRVANQTAESFVTFAGADLGDYDVSLVSDGGDLWTANFPAWIGAGEYIVQYYDRAGASPATTDVKLKDADLYWTGSQATGGDVPTAAEMVDKIKRELATLPMGVNAITSDGQSVQYVREKLLAELKEWEARAARALGRRPSILSIKLGGGYSSQ